MNILITGLPGIGKTMLIKKVIHKLWGQKPVGFYTEERRIRGVRKGFELVSIDGRRGLLSHVEIKSPHKVGKYRVDVKGFEEFLDTISFFDPESNLIIVDEIGKMECFSDKFKTIMKELLDAHKPIIATIALKGGGFISEIKERKDVRLLEITLGNRDSLLTEIVDILHQGI